ncbi:MAG: hypothetical protein ACLQAT_18875 [Candidatus Binataceae bacterium]
MSETAGNSQSRSSSIWGWLPWVVYFVVGGFGYRTIGAFAALFAAAYPVVTARSHATSVKLPELAALAFFILAAGIPLLGGAIASSFWKYNFVVMWIVFAGGAWGSILLGTPFTTMYARESTPREFWETDIFRRTNFVLTLVWALLFSLNLLAVSMVIGATGLEAWIPLIVPTITVVSAFVFTARYTASVQRATSAMSAPPHVA